MAYEYNCRDFPGMGNCVGSMRAATRDEVYKLAELHGRLAHGEDPNQWSQEDQETLRTLIHDV